VLVLPLVAVLLLAIAQVAVVARAHVLVGAAAQEAARAAAVGGTDDDARAAAERAVPLDASRLTVRIDVQGDLVVAEVTYRDDTTVPMVGRLVGPVTVRATVVMRREQ
jgi:pilus assembly protein CpaE